MSREAPLYRDSERFCGWLCQRLGELQHPLATHVLHNALTLRDALILALYDRDRDDNLREADERLLLLRAQLRLCNECTVLTQRQLLYALDQANQIGRQIGAWQRRRDQG